MKVYFDIASMYAYIYSVMNKFKIDESNMKNVSLPMPPLIQQQLTT